MPSPRRFRRRLTAAFVLVAAAAAGILAVVTYALSTEYRNRTFEDRSGTEVRVALALAPEALSEATFARLQAAYESRTGASTVARSDAGYFSSSPGLGEEDIPSALEPPGRGEVTTADARIDGVERFVVAARHNDDEYWFFFSREPVEQSLRDLRTVLGVGWLATTLGAALVGRWVARRTLQPVREASDAARALAAGLLETRLEDRGADEFGAWSAAFNEMADALQETIDQLRAAAERERRFTADIAHELRTPLTTITASASLLEEDLDRLPEPARRSARLLIAEAGRLRNLVLELLELARIDAGAESVSNEPLDVADALDAVVAPLLAATSAPGGAVRIDASPALTVEADRARLRRVVGNLVENGFRHGAPPIEVTAREDGPWVRIEVRDHGPGLQGADPRALFDRFVKADRARSRDGTGLGLAIAAGHAEAMHGELTADDHPSGGARFVLRLRRSEPAAT
jgi:signal transduction histidine kinase